MKEYSFPAMGTEIKIKIADNCDDFYFYEVEKIFLKKEAKFSRFLKDSKLSELNKNKEILFDEEFSFLLENAKKIFYETEKNFNPLLQIKFFGYQENFLEPKKILEKNLKNLDLDLEKIQVSKEKISIGKNQELDFGGFVKGYTVDFVKIFLEKNGIKNFLINAGGDIFAAGEPEKGKKWRVNLYNSEKFFLLQNQALATSGNYKRKWVGSDGKKYHHILNGKSENPEDFGFQTISVIGKSCMLCDAFATSMFSLKKEKGEKILEKNGFDYFYN